MPQKVQEISENFARYVVNQSGGRLNAINDLFRPAAAVVARDYFGLLIDDLDGFAIDSLAVSTMLFSDFGGREDIRTLGLQGAAGLKAVVDRSIDAVIAGHDTRDTPIARLARQHADDPLAVPRAEIHAIMLGMISGFVPTNTLAQGNILDVLMTRADARRQMDRAVASGDDAAIEACLLEALRFKPIRIGPHRIARTDFELPSGRKIKKGDTVMAATHAAMFDPKHVKSPEQFRPGRAGVGHKMVYGYEYHWCLGADLSNVHMTAVFKVLFSQTDLRRAKGRAGRLTRLGAFPDRLDLQWTPKPKAQPTVRNLTTLYLPLKDDADPTDLRETLSNMGQRTDSSVSDVMIALDETGVFHFVSGTVVPLIRSKSGAAFQAAVIEFSADGDAKTAIGLLANVLKDALEGPLQKTVEGAEGRDIDHILRTAAVDVRPLARGATGLCFEGTPGLSVAKIQDEDALADAARDALDRVQAYGAGSAREVMMKVRAELRKDDQLRAIMDRPPSGYGPEAQKPFSAAITGILGQLFAIRWLQVVGAVVFAGFVFWHSQALGLANAGLGAAVLKVTMSVLIVLLGALAIVFVLVLAYVIVLRRKERRNTPSDLEPTVAHMDDVTRAENFGPNNHLISITQTEPGWFRAFTLRFVFLAIQLLAVHWFQKGKLMHIGSIHFARWVRFSGTDSLIFFSNYSGSWNSYLEDFIQKASDGLTGIWSNCIGFPRTRYLIFEGSRDGKNFKDWARNSQIPMAFWYAAYPKLKTADIKRNAVIHAGLHAPTDDFQARQWLSQFGSLAKDNDVLEKQEIQSIVFGGFKHRPNSQILGFGLTDQATPQAVQEFLKILRPHMSWGETRTTDVVCQLAFGPAILDRLNFGRDHRGRVLQNFALPYQQGMRADFRARVLGDDGEQHPDQWMWGNADKPVDIIVMVFAPNPAEMTAFCKRVSKSASAAFLAENLAQDTSLPDTKDGAFREPFGFRDGISQPIIKGSSRSFTTQHQNQVLDAGEFLCGYRDGSGRTSASVHLDYSKACAAHLPLVTTDKNREVFDFGRNGSYLVIRQLEQDVDAFHQFSASVAKEDPSPDVTADYIEAKMIGRWKDGSSLVRCPHEPGNAHGGAPDNDFMFRQEDRQGMGCPMGAHIRRANPRDSQSDNAETQMKVINRHRILRRGRSYGMSGKADTAKGVMFVCLNADIERQFEFVQDTWLNNTAFHGLQNESDPLFARSRGGTGRYSIPTPQGTKTLAGVPNFVTMRGGGYFFLPSKRAVDFLLA